MNGHTLAFRTGLWETVGMAKGYIPKVNDVVLMKGQGFVRYVVTKVDNEAKRADVNYARLCNLLCHMQVQFRNS